MPYCPECKTEYREGIKICSDCEIELVDALPEDVLPDFEDLELIYTTDEYYKAEMIRSNLESAGIDVTILSQKDRNYPGVGNLSVIKLFVSNSDIDAALEYINSINESKNEE